MNNHVVSLIPKIQGANSIKDYKTIVGANFKFKIISEILLNRLAVVAARIISPINMGLCKVGNFTPFSSVGLVQFSVQLCFIS